MLGHWLLLTASLTSLAFAVEPQISSVATLPSQNTVLTVSARSRTPIVPVLEPITFVPATATAQPFFAAPSSTTNPAARSTLFSTNSPGQWPRLRQKLDIPGTLLYLTILDYGLPVDPSFKEDIISNLALIVIDVDHGGNPDQALSAVTYTKGLVSFQYAHRVPWSPYGVKREEMSLVLETVGGLIVADGPRRIQTAFISSGHFLVGAFALYLSVPGSSQPPQNTSLGVPR